MDTCAFEHFHIADGAKMPEVFCVPEFICGKRVVEISPRAFYGCRGLRQVILPPFVQVIGDYAFAECRELEKITFPAPMTHIGDYAFYNCMGLHEISYKSGLSVIGYGAFKNCLELHKIALEIAPDGKNCLNAILQDEFQEVDVTIDYVDDHGQPVSRARLVFTDYQYEYVPEIEARQFNWETYGSGDSYRISIRDKDIDYVKYDSVFPVAMVEDDENTLQKIAASRLCWPHKLSKEARQGYENYLKAHLLEVLTPVISGQSLLEEPELLFAYLLNRRLLSDENLSEAFKLCECFHRPELTAQLMEYSGKMPEKNEQSPRRRFAL